MSGTIVRVVNKQQYDFSGMATGTSSTLLVAKGIDLSAAREGQLVVRVHALNITGTKTLGTISIMLKTDSPTDEDPSTEFTAGVYNIATVVLSSQTVLQAFPQGIGAANTNSCLTSEIVTPLPGKARLYISPYQGDASAVSAFNATISADIVLKT